MIRPHSGPYPHVAGCAGCRVRRLCDVCGAPVFPRVVTRLLSRCLAHAGALVLCLLLSVSSASAECAWVLWSNFISRDPTAPHAASSGGLWIPESAGTRAECERSRDRMVTVSLKNQAMGPGTQRNASGGGAESAGVFGPNGQTVMTCLPDTVDPRGPKGEGRR